jgi:endoglucanase
MIDIKDFLKTLITLPGLSANEGPARDAISKVWEPLVDELSTSPLGSLHALKRGTAKGERPRILLAAHMDAIGLMVTEIDGGFLRIIGIGGVDSRILPGQPVTVHGRRDIPAVVVQPPAALLPVEVGARQSVEMKYLLVDTGLEEDEVRSSVRVGDLISFAQPPMELNGDLMVGHSMDNRSSVAAVTVCLEELGRLGHAWDVWAVATVQEENVLGGASTSPFEIRPQIAVAVDVTFGRGPGGPTDYRTFPIGKGPTIGWGPNIHPALFRMMKDTADRLEIPHHVEVMPRHSGTDGYAMQVVAEGIPTLVIGLPLRYMHTPVEIISIKDIQRIGRLLAEFIAGLEPESLEKIRWDDEP